MTLGFLSNVPGDKYLDCDQIRLTIADNNTKIMSLVPQQKKGVKNAALGVAGVFLIVPWFFMDFSDAERVEVQAYQERNSYLYSLGSKLHCKDLPAPIKFKGQ